MSREKAKRRWRLPRMSLATLLVLVAVAGGSAGWYAHSARVQRQAVRALRAAGATVIYDWEWDPGATALRGNGKELAGWRRALADRFGPDAVASVAAISLQGVAGRDGPGATDEHIELVGRLKSLRGLLLGEFAVTEAGAAPIAGLGRLRILAILGKSDPGPILSRLGEGSRLKQLFLVGAAIDDEDIAAISRLSRLETLQISGGPRKIGDADLAKLSGLGRLKGLDFLQTAITSEGLKSIERMKSLESISLVESSIGDLTPFLRLPALRHLHLGYSPVGDDGISVLAEMRGLEQFGLSSNALTDAGLAHLGNLPALEKLKLYGESITDAGLARLGSAPALKMLELRSHSITAAGLESLAAIKTIENIKIFSCKINIKERNSFVNAHSGIGVETTEMPASEEPECPPIGRPAID